MQQKAGGYADYFAASSRDTPQKRAEDSGGMVKGDREGDGRERAASTLCGAGTPMVDEVEDRFLTPDAV